MLLFIREDGSHVTSDQYGSDEHYVAAHKEIKRRGWTHSDEVRALANTEPFRDLYEVLRRGYVRTPAEAPCAFEVWRLAVLSREARAEMELIYLRARCREVIVDESAPPPLVRTIRPTHFGGLAAAFD